MNIPPEFDLWAPQRSPWSLWTKPVLFAHLNQANNIDLPALNGDFLPAASGDTALVIDAPGIESITLALAAAQRGYRPVPLYNSAPGPDMIIDLIPLISALRIATPQVVAAGLVDGAPPAFLLDASRMRGTPAPRRFDNRWAVVPQDFPSANLLLASGIRQVVVLRVEEREDLDHVLLRWQQAGLTILGLTPGGAGELMPLTLRKPWWFGLFFARLMVLSGLRRNSAGGFGARVPEPSQG